jgi:hypothetical protein
MHSFVRRHSLYWSHSCVWCHSDINNKESHPQVIPINPELYAYYWCETCFWSTSVENIVRQTRAYLTSEKGLVKEQRAAWISGKSGSPFVHLEHSIKFLRGFVTHPPFNCAAFSLRAVRTDKPVISRQHLTLILLS